MKMKKKKLLLTVLGLMVSSMAFQACSLDDDNDYDMAYPSALVTVKPNADNSQFYMQLDDSTTLIPTNLKASPFGKKEVRALVNYYRSNEDAGHYSHAVYVNWIDSILTKTLAPCYDEEENKAKYGDDALEIVDDWVTVAEDGYLTLRFRTRWGGGSHVINLVKRVDINTPNYFALYHNAKGDKDGRIGDALVAFRLPEDMVANNHEIELTLEWKSYSGKKTAKFKMRPRQPATIATERFNAANIYIE